MSARSRLARLLPLVLLVLFVTSCNRLPWRRAKAKAHAKAVAAQHARAHAAEPAPTATPTATPTAAPTAAPGTELITPPGTLPTEVPVQPQPPLTPEKVDLGKGVTVEVHRDRTISLKGKDRWGESLTTTYEAPSFFKNAVPVLTRRLEDDQAAKLKEVADKLP